MYTGLQELHEDKSYKITKNGKTIIKYPFLACLFTWVLRRARHSWRQKSDLPYLLVCFLVHIFHNPADI